MNSETITTYFGYHTPSFLVKVNQNKGETIRNQINELLIEFVMKNHMPSMMERLLLDPFIKKVKDF